MRRFFLYMFLFAIGSVALKAQTQWSFDYSRVGYRQCNDTIPTAVPRLFVRWQKGDQSRRLQAAIDALSKMKIDKRTRLRGAVVLDTGTFVLRKPLLLRTNGIIVRGSGTDKTTLLKTGVDRGAVVYIEGSDNRQYNTDAKDNIVKGISGSGEYVFAQPSTKEWIKKMHCNNFGGGSDLGYWGWHPGEIDLEATRTVGADGSFAPLPFSTGNNGYWKKMVWPGRIHDCGIENLSIVADYSKGLEDHAWDGVYVANAIDCWVRRIDFRHLAGSAVVIQRTGAQVTVEDCRSYDPISEVGGYRRRTFLCFGERCLFQRLYSEHGIHDFSVGMLAAGPNVFSQCDSYESLGYSGSTGSMASAVLFDNVNIDGNDLKFCNLGLEDYGIGWNATNSTFYQCTASAICADSLPDGSCNYAHGCWGQFIGTGTFTACNDHVRPRSLFHEQLKKRLTSTAKNDKTSPIDLAKRIVRLYERDDDDATSSPTIERALQLAQQAHEPRMTMERWSREGLSVLPVKAKDFAYQEPAVKSQPSVQYTLQGNNILFNGKPLIGSKAECPWWNGRVRYSTMAKLPDAVTRFVPGMEGQGATDRIDSVVAHLQACGVRFFDQHYGLWYDRRRDDHERVRRKDGDVWAPFYEQAFARSGQGKAWDGLSRYDLTKLNPWYFSRVHELAQKSAPKGIMVINQSYFQHNILEAGAHWVDCPWREANNINHTGTPEPVPFAGDKRIFMATYFYNVNDSTMRQLHRQYIFKTLDALGDCPNIIFSIGEEYTGPYDFTKFWIETVGEWEKAHHPVSVALNTTKDVQDSILKDKDLNKIVNIICIEQWYYHAKGLFAPPGGVSMAPRQYLRKIRTGKVRQEDVERAIKETEENYPDKVVIYFGPQAK